MEGVHLDIQDLIMNCACEGELEYTFNKKLGLFVECQSCGRQFPIDDKQRPKHEAMKESFESEINRHKEIIETLKQRKECTLNRYYE